MMLPMSASVISRNGIPCRRSTVFHPWAQGAQVFHSVPSRSKTTDSNVTS
jgi:hypothetical protein